MMDGNDENNIGEFAMEMLRRAKERSQFISGGADGIVKEKSLGQIMEILGKDSSTTSRVSPVKSSSPIKPGTRPILKPSNSKDNSTEQDTIVEQRSVKKTVSTFDAMTGDTIVEAKTFMSDDEDESTEETEMDAEESGCDSIVDADEVNELSKGEDSGNDEKHFDQNDDECGTSKVETTPQLSRTLKKLAEFHSKEEVDSPIHPHTPLETFNHGHDDDGGFGRNRVSASRKARTSRLSALAKTINEWEDDTSHLSIPGSRFHENSFSTNARTSLAGKSRYSSASSPSASSPLSLGAGRQNQVNGVRLFSKTITTNVSNTNKNSNSKYQSGKYGGGLNQITEDREHVNYNSDNNRLGFEHTVLSKLQSNSQGEKPISDDWDEALMKSLELQGFSRRQGSPLKQIRERTTDKVLEHNEDESMQQQSSPTKTYFGGSPSKSSPQKLKPSHTQPVSSPANNSPSRLSASVLDRSPIKPSSPTKPVTASFGKINSPSPKKSPVKSAFTSPLKVDKSSSNESTPSGKPVSAIRMRFEAGASQPKLGPVKPERSRFTPYAGSTRNNMKQNPSSSSPTKKFHFGETEKDPSTLSVAERAKLFESSKFCLAPAKKSQPVEIRSKTPTIFTSSPCVDNVKPQDIDVSSVVPIPTEHEVTSPKKRPAPTPPVKTASPISYGKGPAPPPPPPPPMPNTSTPTNPNPSSKRRSTSPARSFPKESLAVKRIKVNAPKPGRMYPSLTDIETETETEAEGHCSEVESMDDSIESEKSLGAEIESIAKACSPIVGPSSGGKLPPRYRPSEDFSATFACAEVDALIDEALDGQEMTTTTINCSTTLLEAEKTVNASANEENISENGSASLERTVVSIENSAKLSPPSRCGSLNESVSEPEALEDAQVLSCSDADTTASSSFTSSPVAQSNLYANADSNAVTNLNNVVSVEPVETPTTGHDPPAKIEQMTEDEPFTPRTLMHTVSFYRKQQQQQKKNETCGGLNDISEQPESNGNESSEDETPIEKPNIGAMIRKLEDEVEGRNLAIAQASKALNWCKALVGFSDSTEYIECERILLIETQRRLALLNSIHRMKTEGALNHQMPSVFSPSKQEVTPSCKGNMKISGISITLRREFFNAHRAENQYHFIVLIKNKHHIEHTPLLTYDSQKQGSTLRFSNDFDLQGLDPEFQINLEIYYLESAKEFLPHEAKYRINAKKDAKHSTMLLSPLLTPSKKGGKGDHHKPQIHSPAGPDTVKTSSFKFCGGLSIDISSLQRTYWELDKVAGPLTGAISLNVQCSAMGGVEHKGFLTLFEDVSGYGAWVRRWCRLGPAVLEFWKYPEDETDRRKPPLGTLNLHDCVTSKVRPAPRDVCARANTLLLVTTRAPHPNDKDTLVTSCHKGYTAVRHLISADTREERDVWCQRLNKALANLRAWDPVAKQSVDDNLF